MNDYRQAVRRFVLETLLSLYADTDTEMRAQIEEALSFETPPDSNLGDIAFPMFPYAKLLRRNPVAIATAVAEVPVPAESTIIDRVQAAGPYVNVFLNRALVFPSVVAAVLADAESYGCGSRLAGKRIMIEFSSPNTNKPLHLGHLRNDALGESVARLLRASGATVRKVNLINDRGVHICKSMLAYREFGNGETPESTGKKSDHFVGDYYVRYAQWEKEDTSVEQRAREMLQRWEEGDEEVHRLWEQMNGWAIGGISQTYNRTGIHFDQLYYESQTYRSGRDEITKGLERGIFTRDEAGTVWVDLTDIGLDRKVLLRSDGTSLYLTQDIGTAIHRSRDWPFDQLIYVVASEQRYHFQVLFEVLRRIGVEWAGQLHHLSYGMVNLPDGKMKSREGTVVDADDLLDELTRMAAEEIRSKGRVEHVGEVETTAAKVALAALHYYLLQTTPTKDMVFDPAESLSFNGNTGPYLQYVGARVSSMLRKQPIDGFDPNALGDAAAPDCLDEWVLAKQIADFPRVVEEAGRLYSPALVAGFLYELAKNFSRFYHDQPIAIADDPRVRTRRLALSKAVLVTMRNGLELLNIPFVEAM